MPAVTTATEIVHEDPVTPNSTDVRNLRLAHMKKGDKFKRCSSVASGIVRRTPDDAPAENADVSAFEGDVEQRITTGRAFGARRG
jgi:hypothetical protein